MSGRGRTSRLMACIAATATLAAGCGVGENDHPELITRENVPHGLLDQSAVSTSAPDTSSRTVTVFLVEPSSNRTTLHPVQREVSGELTIRSVLEALFEQRTEDEVDDGYVTYIGREPGVRSVQAQAKNTIVVDLTKGTLILEGVGAQLAFAQIVYTLTQLDGVDRVAFRVDGGPVEAITDDGTLSTQPVNRSHYRAFAPD